MLALRELKQPAEREEPWELPSWVKGAFVHVDLGGMTYAEAAAQYNKAPTTLSNYASSPAAKKWRESVEEVANDPAILAKGVLEAAVADCSANLIWALEAAKRADDYKEVRIAASHLLDRLNIQKVAAPESKPTIVVNVTAASRPETIEVEAEVVEEEDVEVEEEEA